MTVGNTPVSSPGLFSPTASQPTHSAPTFDQSVSIPSPHLHPSHLQTPKETHVAAVDHDLYTGNKVINGYEVLSEIGRGEHGKVKLGQNLENRSLVAMKIVPRFSSKRRLGKLGAPEDPVKKEVAILKKARHPNVVSLLEVIDDPSKRKVYIVLEYVEHGEIRWRRKGAREIVLINNRRLAFEREGRSETSDTYEQDMLIMRQARTRRKRVLDRSRSIGQNPVPYWSLEYGENKDEEASSPRIKRVASVTTHRSGEAGSISNDLYSLPSGPDRQAPSPLEARPPPESVANASTVSQQSSERWDDDDDELSYVPTLTLAEAQSACRDTLLGLEFLHFQGIIHRDIKPANLLVSSEGHVKISDFGVSYLGKPLRDDEDDKLGDKLSEKEAKDLDDPRLLARTVGTPAFYAPELIYWDTDIFEGGKGPTITGAIDLWALGVTLYGMIFGRLPFFGDGEWGLFEKIMHEDVFLPKQRLRPVDFEPDSRASSQVQMEQPRSSSSSSGRRRGDHELAYEDVPESLRDLIRLLLVKDPAHRITMERTKMHSWVVEGMEDPGRWIGDTDPKRHGEERIVVSGEDVSHAVVKKTVLERAIDGVKETIDGVKEMAGNLMDKAHRSHRSRKRAVSAATSASASVESIVSNSAALGASVGREKKHSNNSNDNLHRRASVWGDEMTTARASREGEHHPLSQSLLASAVDSNQDADLGIDTSVQSVKSSSTGCSPLVEEERATRPPNPGRVFSALSTADSTKTVRAPQPQPGRSRLLDSGHDELYGSTLVEAAAASISNIFSGARKRLSGVGSRERRPLEGSRSSSAEGQSFEGTGYAGPSVAVSKATALGQVSTPETLRAESESLEEVSSQSSLLDGRPRRVSPFQPSLSSTTAFGRAQEANVGRQMLDADMQADRAGSRLGGRPAGLDCSSSPDDEIYRIRTRGDVEVAKLHTSLSNLPSASTIASSAAAELGGISQSTSQPSIPSVESGASSIYPEESPLLAGESEVQSVLSTGETVTGHDRAVAMRAGGTVPNTFGEDDDGSSEDEGLTFGNPRKRSTTNRKKK